ncbi:MAG TPA: HEAT repeat domain-containing protein, partial [Planctomycetota bacterium]|nr:HEAT repeat domain-containing protein [Planctomycetota bacterium]
FGRYRVPQACRFARLGISDQDQDVRQAAASALSGIEQPEVYRFLADSLEELAKGAPAPRELDLLLSIIEKKKDPIAATGVIVEALPAFSADGQKLRASLKRMTGCSFEQDEDWRRWYDDHKTAAQRDWYLEALKNAEDQGDKAQAAAERIFERLLAALAHDEPALMRELEDAVSKDSLPSVRVAAIKALGGIGARTGSSGDRSVALLENLLKQQPPQGRAATPPRTATDIQDDATLCATLVALGRTARANELNLILPYLEHPARSVRLATAASLGALRADGSVPPLVKVLATQPPLEARDAEAASVFARSLGACGHDPEGKSSTALLQFLDRVQKIDPATARPPLLQAGAEALGGLGPALVPEGDTAAAIVSTLACLSEPTQNQDVRWWATTSLGRIPHRQALSVLSQRVHDETLNVRRAAIGGIGLEARRKDAPEDLVKDGVSLLAQELAGTDEALRRAARSELDEVVARDTQTFGALDALVDALSKRGAADLAAPFLDGLPAPDKITEPQKKFLARYWSLIETRAGARLRLLDGRGAAADYELLLGGPGATGAKQRAYMLGRAKALLAAGDPKAAAERAAELARLDPKDDGAWSTLRQAADALLGRGEKVVVKEVLASVDRALAQAPAEVQAGFQETLRKATDKKDAP